MDKRGIVLARRYARAYLSLYQDLTPENYQGCYKAAALFKQKPDIGFLLDLSLIARDVKVKELELIIKACGLPASCNAIGALLIDHHRASLLGELFVQLAQLYKQQAGIDTCTVKSSTVLSTQEKKDIEQALERKTEQALTFVYSIDPGLIAGMRCQTSSFLWEHSVEQVVRRLENSLKH